MSDLSLLVSLQLCLSTKWNLILTLVAHLFSYTSQTKLVIFFLFSKLMLTLNAVGNNYI